MDKPHWYEDRELATKWYGRVVVAYGCIAAVYIVVVVAKIIVEAFR